MVQLNSYETAIVDDARNRAKAYVINVFVDVAAESTALEAETILEMMERYYVEDYDPERSNIGLSLQDRGARLIQIARGLVGEVT